MVRCIVRLPEESVEFGNENGESLGHLHGAMVEAESGDIP